MPSILAHALVGYVATEAFLGEHQLAGPRLLVISAAILPDLDILPGLFGHSATAIGGHRGLTHAIPFAILLAAVISWAAERIRGFVSRRRMFFALTVSCALHGIVDAFTVYGTGVTLLAPFSWARIQSAWRPLGDIGITTGRTALELSLATAWNELVWIAFPCMLGILLTRALRQR